MSRPSLPAAVTLAFEQLGGGVQSGLAEPLVILHGLFGHGGNWRSLGRELAREWPVLNLDLRNHGDSGQAEEHSYPALAADVLATLGALGIGRVHLLGHSMGGKAAMWLTSHFPERVASLIVVDIAPRPYPPLHEDIFEALTALPVAALPSRRAGEELLRPLVPEPDVRRFLLADLVSCSGGGYRWRMNLPVLRASYAEINAMPGLGVPFTGPVLFIRGGNSSYIGADDLGLIRAAFPQARIATIPTSRHWPHTEAPQAFLTIVRHFLNDPDPPPPPDLGPLPLRLH